MKLCPHLKENALYPSHFDKMNVAYSVGLLNHNVAAAIMYHIANGKIDSKHKTTAWFLTTIHKWFQLLTGRYYKVALSHFDEDVFNDTINFLQEFMNIVQRIKVGNGTWKPFQSGILLCTQTVLDIQKEYLEKHKFKFLMLGRFTQDALENLFPVIRARNAVSDAREFKQALRLVCLSQFQCNIDRGNYSVNDSEHLVQYCKEMKQHTSKTMSRQVQGLESSSEEYLLNAEIYELLNEPDLSNDTQAALYHLLGALLHTIKSNHKHCDNCFNILISDNNVIIM